MIQVIGEPIVLRLETDIPNQPAPEQLEADPFLCRFTLIVDRAPPSLKQQFNRSERKEPKE
ncbi:MAG: hypothetical protein O2960_06845 [Verrucomicrobia bacterium]|nr:hypothetical protein [Verrucomicrobiota bacterium]